MTKKDYIAIANGIKEVKRTVNQNCKESVYMDHGINQVIDKLADIFQIDNNNFNHVRFMGYIADSNKHLKSYYWSIVSIITV